MPVVSDDIPTIRIDQSEIPVRVRVNRRARRLILKVDALAGAVDLTCPSKRSVPEGLAFVQQRAGWIRERLAEAPPRRPFVDGAHIPVQGIPHLIVHTGDRRRGVTCLAETQQLHVGGEAQHLPRRVEDWLKRKARQEFCQLADEFTGQLDVTRRRISVRDTRTRWGSCSSEGAISLSWRLIMAPLPVYRYVIAHEVAHLKHMDHSRRFWSVVDRLIDDRADAQNWLKENGETLYGFGGAGDPVPTSRAA